MGNHELILDGKPSLLWMAKGVELITSQMLPDDFIHLTIATATLPFSPSLNYPSPNQLPTLLKQRGPEICFKDLTLQ